MRVDTTAVPALRTGLETLADLLEHATFRLPFPGRDEHEADRNDLVRTIREYLLPRLRDPDAPVVASIVGATGVGKSTVMNTLAQDKISEAGVLRPTTRSPVLWAHRDHAGRYWSEFVARVRERVGPALEVVIGDDPLTTNLTIIDTPPVDFLAKDGTLAAHEVLLLSDLCVFVASVGRYADAAGWQFLHDARRRGTPILFVLNRLPGDEVVANQLLEDYSKRLFEDDLLLEPDPSLVFGVNEGNVERWHGGLPPGAVAGIRKELGELADPDFRQGLVDQTTYSSIRALAGRAEELEGAFRREREASRRLADAVDRAYEAERAAVRVALVDGKFASVAEHAFWPQAAVDLTGIITRRAGVAAQQAAAAWAEEPTGATFLDEGGHGLWRHGHDTTYETQRLLEQWAGNVEEMAVNRARGRWFRASVRKKAVGQIWPHVLKGGAEENRWLSRRFGDSAGVVVREARSRLEDALGKALMVDAARFLNFMGDPSPLHDLDRKISDQVATIVAGAEGRDVSPRPTRRTSHDRGAEDLPSGTAASGIDAPSEGVASEPETRDEERHPGLDPTGEVSLSPGETVATDTAEPQRPDESADAPPADTGPAAVLGAGRSVALDFGDPEIISRTTSFVPTSPPPERDDTEDRSFPSIPPVQPPAEEAGEARPAGMSSSQYQLEQHAQSTTPSSDRPAFDMVDTEAELYASREDAPLGPELSAAGSPDVRAEDEIDVDGAGDAGDDHA